MAGSLHQLLQVGIQKNYYSSILYKDFVREYLRSALMLFACKDQR